MWKRPLLSTVNTAQLPLFPAALSCGRAPLGETVAAEEVAALRQRWRRTHDVDVTDLADKFRCLERRSLPKDCDVNQGFLRKRLFFTANDARNSGVNSSKC